VARFIIFFHFKSPLSDLYWMSLITSGPILTFMEYLKKVLFFQFVQEQTSKLQFCFPLILGELYF